MKHNFFSVLSIMTLLAGMLVITTSATSAAVYEPPQGFSLNNMAPAGPGPMDLNSEMLGKDEIAIRKLAAEIGPVAITNTFLVSEQAEVGDEYTITVRYGLHTRWII